MDMFEYYLARQSNKPASKDADHSEFDRMSWRQQVCDSIPIALDAHLNHPKF